MFLYRLIYRLEIRLPALRSFRPASNMHTPQPLNNRVPTSREMQCKIIWRGRRDLHGEIPSIGSSLGIMILRNSLIPESSETCLRRGACKRTVLHLLYFLDAGPDYTPINCTYARLSGTHWRSCPPSRLHTHARPPAHVLSFSTLQYSGSLVVSTRTRLHPMRAGFTSKPGNPRSSVYFKQEAASQYHIGYIDHVQQHD